MSRLTDRFRRSKQAPVDIERLEEKLQTLAAATEQWMGLLRDMERDGESGDPRYERYYQAYIEARRLEKRAELELFNARSGLIVP